MTDRTLIDRIARRLSRCTDPVAKRLLEALAVRVVGRMLDGLIPYSARGQR